MQVEKIVHHIVDWLSTYSKNAGTSGFVVGVSGGIDSAVTSTLCARTGLPLLVLEMPIHQGASQVSRAADHIDWLMREFPNVQRQEVELTPVFDQLIAELEAELAEPGLAPLLERLESGMLSARDSAAILRAALRATEQDAELIDQIPIPEAYRAAARLIQAALTPPS